MTERLIGSLALLGVTLLSALITVAAVDRVHPLPLVLYPIAAVLPMALLLTGVAVIRPKQGVDPEQRAQMYLVVLVGPTRRTR